MASDTRAPSAGVTKPLTDLSQPNPERYAPLPRNIDGAYPKDSRVPHRNPSTSASFDFPVDPHWDGKGKGKARASAPTPEASTPDRIRNRMSSLFGDDSGDGSGRPASLQGVSVHIIQDGRGLVLT